MRHHVPAQAVLLLFLSFVVACSKPATEQATQTQSEQQQAQGVQPNEPSQANPASPQGRAKVETAAKSSAPRPGLHNALTIPSGAVLTVRMGQSVSSKNSRPGETFTATLVQPVAVEATTVIPAGAEATGTVTDAVPLGRFKGGAKLALKLDSITIDGKKYNVQTTAVSRSAQGKGKRTGVLIGGGAGLGALIGGLAGGGKGAAIGALAGAGAGTAGSAFTGNKDIVIPAESAVSFKLLEPVQVK